MNDTVAVAGDVNPDLEDHPGEHHTHGPSTSTYFTIFWVLVAITALEVSTYFWSSWSPPAAGR